MTQFKAMLAAKANPAKLKFPLFVQAKFDGIRCSIVDGKPLTRTLKDVSNNEIGLALSGPQFEGLDGELIVGDPTAPDCYRRTVSFVMSADKTGEPWSFYVFDFHDSQLAYEQRLTVLRTGPHMALSDRIRIIGATLVSGAAELEAYEADAVAEGHEGVILRSPDALYKFGRASATKGELLKLKRFDDFEAEVIGVYEEMHNANEATTNALGRTERSSHQANKIGKGRLGGLILRGITDYEGVEFRCGTGFDATEREQLWQGSVIDTERFLNGNIVKIKHFVIGSKDKPRFPTFLGWRDERDI